MKTFEQLLQEDEQQRRTGVSDGLLTELPKEPWTWDFPVPTLCHPPKSSYLGSPCTQKMKAKMTLSADGLSQNLCKQFPGLSVLLEDPCVVVAGGCVQAVLMSPNLNLDNYRFADMDVDVFLVGLTDTEAATAKVVELARKLVTCWTSTHKHKIGKDNAVLTSNTLTLNGLFKCQFILRLYKTKEEILFGFDLPCCSIGISGSVAYFTPLCALALQTKVCAVRPHRASPNFLHRIQKYFNRGYDMALVDSNSFALDTNKSKSPTKKEPAHKRLNCGGTVEKLLGHQMTLYYAKDPAQANKLLCSMMSRIDSSLDTLDSLKDYDSGCDSRVIQHYLSLVNIATPDYKCPMIYSGSLSVDFVLSDLQPVLTKARFNSIVAMFLAGVCENFRKSTHKVVFRAMCKMFPAECAALFLSEDIDACVELVARFKKEMHQRIALNPFAAGLNWLVENPGEQLTASFKPCPMTPEALYSQLF